MIRIISKYIIKTGQIVLWIYSRILVKVFLKVDIDKSSVFNKNHTGVLIISSHVSIFDPSILVGSLSWREFMQIYPIRAMLAKWYFHSPILPIAYIGGCFPARPLIGKLKKYSGTSAAIRILNDGQSLGIYPEGQRSPDKRIPAKYGVVKILQNTTDQTVYGCLITKHSRRHYSMKLKNIDYLHTYTDPDKIMDEVYKLADTI